LGDGFKHISRVRPAVDSVVTFITEPSNIAGVYGRQAPHICHYGVSRHAAVTHFRKDTNGVADIDI
jgi:hypothetical protein